jgi:phosphatidate cytidylyltransferase
MPTPLWTNPLDYPTFLPVITVVAAVFLGSGMALLLLFRGNLYRFQQTNLGQRYLGWLMLAPLFLAGIYTGRVGGLAVLLGFMLIALNEAARLVNLPAVWKHTLFLLAAASVLASSELPALFFILPVFYFVILTSLAIHLNDPARGYRALTASLFASLWIIYSGAHFVLLSRLDNAVGGNRILLAALLLAVAFADIGAYLVGKATAPLALAKRLLIAPRLSPRKTYLGALGHIAGAALGLLLLGPYLRDALPPAHWITAASLIGLQGMWGGFLNSLFKRAAGVKDSGKIIPGHGGVLDRIDSLLRAVVFFYYYLIFTVRPL